MQLNEDEQFLIEYLRRNDLVDKFLEAMSIPCNVDRCHIYNNNNNNNNNNGASTVASCLSDWIHWRSTRDITGTDWQGIYTALGSLRYRSNHRVIPSKIINNLTVPRGVKLLMEYQKYA